VYRFNYKRHLALQGELFIYLLKVKIIRISIHIENISLLILHLSQIHIFLSICIEMLHSFMSHNIYSIMFIINQSYNFGCFIILITLLSFLYVCQKKTLFYICRCVLLVKNKKKLKFLFFFSLDNICQFIFQQTYFISFFFLFVIIYFYLILRSRVV